MTLGPSGKPFDILLVEDNPGDARLAEEAIKDSRHKTKVTVVGDGEAAMAYLKKDGEYADAPVPDLILLDLKLPKKDGAEVLEEISQDRSLSNIPLVILTGTLAEISLLHSYGIRPSRYMSKPLEVGRFDAVLGQLNTLVREPVRIPVARHAPASREEEAVGGKKRRWWPFGKG